MTTTKIKLPADVVEGAIAHMNGDHQKNLLAYAKVLAGCEWAEAAEMTAIDAQGFELLVKAADREESQRIEFEEPVGDGHALRMALVDLAQKADLPDGIRRVATAEVETNKASRYLKALCNHFDRKAEASYDDTNGRVAFPFGECEMHATDTALKLSVTAESETMFTRTKHVVGDHLVRFAQKEELQVNWIDAQ